ncbi:MAG: tRNA guanosine(34) transglycosylase Tgt, partial [Chthonomonadales bacterium]
VGEPRESRNDCLDWCLELLPLEKPRYLMGVGTPLDILDAVDRGVDMFDCVLPTRNARNAQVFTLDGILNMKNAVHADDFGAMSADCGCAVCAKHSRAYIRHLFVANEILGSRLTTYHNLYFYGNVMERIRGAIQADRFRAFKTEFETRYGASKFAIADEE